MQGILGGSWARKVGSGVSFILCGVAFLTLNERRDVAQGKLRYLAQKKCLHLEETDTVSIDASLRGRLLHYNGTCFGDEGAADFFLGVESTAGQQILVLQRITEMYQWKEREVIKYLHTGKEKTKQISYEYDKVWSARHLDVQHDPDKRNPAMPADLESKTFMAKGLKIGKADHLMLNAELTSQLVDFKPIPAKAFIKDEKKLPHGLYVKGSQLMNGTGYVSNSIGDLRVFYNAVLSGPYTAVAKLEIGDDGQNYLVPYTAKMRESLASQGKIEIPEDLNELLGIKLDSFVIPEEIIAKVETLLLQLAPLQINYLGSGHQSVRASFQNIEGRDYNTLQGLRWAGGAMIFVGTLMTLPVALSSTPAGIVAAMIGAGGMAWKTIETAKPKSIQKAPNTSKYDEEL